MPPGSAFGLRRPCRWPLVAAFGLMSLGASEARADFRVCNATQNLVGVGIGYRAKAGWITEGWWHIEGSTCKTLIEGPLSSRFYYLYAEDAERGGRWDGPINMCVAEKEFKIAGVNDCFARGFQRAGFQEYDTGEQASWMVQLTDEPATDGDAAATGTNQSMRRSRKVKILATIGPASSAEEMLQKLFEAGADVFRINMSHTDHDLMRTLVGRIRAVEEEVGRPIGILADLQGPKLRVGKFADGKVDADGRARPSRSTTTRRPATPTRVYLPHPEILQSVEPGHRLLIDDGKLRAQGRDDATASRSSAPSSPAPRSPTRRASACPTPTCRSAR